MEFWKFKTEAIAINCQTEQEANDLLILCDKKGLKWAIDNTSLLTKNDTKWHYYKEKTCYHYNWIEDGIIFARMNSYINKNHKIITYQNFIKELETRFFYFDEIRKTGRKVKLKNWDKFYSLEKALEVLADYSLEERNNAFDEKAWEVEGI